MTMRDLSHIWRSASIVLACSALSACSLLNGGSSSPGAAPTAATLTASAPATRSAAASQAGTEPGILAVTSAGALVRLNTATGAVAQTLVPSGVTGDEISAANGTVYFTAQQGSDCSVESIPAAGGTPSVIASGGEPAISPDGTKLAYTTWPLAGSGGCSLPSGDPASGAPGDATSGPPTDAYPGRVSQLMIRALAGGQTVTIPQEPLTQEGIPQPISHLSWSPDGSHLAVSLGPIQEQAGWAVNLLDVATAQYYQSGTGVSTVTSANEDVAKGGYLREGVYLPDGDVFISQACCTGTGPLAKPDASRLLLEVNQGGTVTRQVAVGYPTLTHDSLAVSANGGWLLYLGGGDLYVSKGGATPTELSNSGFLAATWG
jgi:WD40-like Beta Propeller Repeat